MKTRDPDHPGAHRLSPIKPGTLCLLVRDGVLRSEYVGRTVTTGKAVGDCPCRCVLKDLYEVTAPWINGVGLIARAALQPILPPGIDDQVEHAIGNPQLEVV